MNEYQTNLQYGYILEDKIYLKGFLEYPDRKIGQVKESEAASIKYFEDRFQLAKQKVYDLEQKIEEAQNKGSYLMKLVHMRKYLANFDGLGDYTVLFAKLDELEEQLRALIAVNRVKNLEIKTALLKEAEDIFQEMEDGELNTTGDRMKEVKQKWIKTGSVLEDQQTEIEQKFDELYHNFFEHRKNVMKNKARLSKDRMNYYRRILFAAEDWKNSDNFDGGFQEFRNMQNAWKTGGKIPHRKAVEMWEKFKRANDWFFNRYKKYKSYRDTYPDMSGKEIKEKLSGELCYEAEALVLYDKERPENVDKAKELLMQWKNISSTFKEIDEDISERFRHACDKVFEFSYLIRVVKRKYPDVERKPDEDQYRIKISFLRELIRKDETELATAEVALERELKAQSQQQSSYGDKGGYGDRGYGNRSNYGGGYQKNYGDNQQNQYNNRLSADSLAIQKRKVKVKKQILKELEDGLNKIKKKF
ncbi:MAG: DUF349 domain-containing protein [Microscillaceae bacterium]|jgi:hypothetical protein|nr:DUF349 domain-containing protein [Microscillaceae bacterium]